MNDKIFDLLINAVVLFTCIPVHECAHAWAANKLGDPTGKNQGRITLNPFAHLTIWGSLLMVLVGFGWGKPVSVNPNNFKNRKKGMVLTSLAGPASNLILAYIAMVVCRVCDNIYYIKGSETADNLATVFFYVTFINICLAVFNFLPIPPLDGSKIFNAILPERIYFKIMQYENIIFLVLVVLVYSGLLDTPLRFLQTFVYYGMYFLTGWVDSISLLFLNGAAI